MTTTTIAPPRNLLTSYHFYKDFDIDRFAGYRIAADSGAFSAMNAGASISVKELSEWILRWQDRFCWAASLDVIGDRDGTRRNWHQMVDDYGIEAVPTVHFGAPPTDLDYYAERGVDFVGLGGLVGKPVPRQMRWIITMFKYARDHHPDMRFHGWGVTSPRIMQLPWFSVDSSGWSSSYRYGRLVIRDPHTGKAHTVVMNGSGTYEPEVARIMREHYGVNPRDAAYSNGANRPTIVRLSLLSASVQEQHFRRLHRRSPISTPKWGQFDRRPSGPHQHLALPSAADHHADMIAGMIVDGPHQHLAVGTPGVGEGMENVQIERLMAGPHQHLAVGGILEVDVPTFQEAIAETDEQTGETA
ncbi:queuine tRNA-ribosyltransferase [Gordonia phage Sour]|uniref:Queuine tRNA-ribosyltransferase n=1 Tax=Gordonia phage Sour TaxID=2182349 RepID=A0A2U8UKE7_9CAUD|nr:queuine tRNA-ribosyltransferase [Gordonia phage Sour]AWN04204.1 queuine tRNA-ribosyltransferase [Gordonia phage Sour]